MQGEPEQRAGAHEANGERAFAMTGATRRSSSAPSVSSFCQAFSRTSTSSAATPADIATGLPDSVPA